VRALSDRRRHSGPNTRVLTADGSARHRPRRVLESTASPTSARPKPAPRDRTEVPGAGQTRRLLAGIAAFAFALRVVVAIATRSWDIPSDEGHFLFGYEMGQIGNGIAKGHGFSWPTRVLFHAPGPTAWMPPVYPLIIGAVFALFGAFTPTAAIVLELLQAALASACCVLVFLLARRLFDARAGYAAAVMLAVYPPAVHFAVQKIGRCC
jgi:hypothetical protein